MSEIFKIKKGLDIKMVGAAEKIFVKAGPSQRYAVKPPDFHGVTPKMVVKAEDKVKAGTTLFFDKYRPEVKFTSPVSGTVLEIRRGERRRILEVVIESDGNMEYEEFGKESISDLKREKIIKKLLETGLWPFIRQRPYGTIANPEDTPRDIFISAFDSAPLAPDNDFIVTGQEEDLKAGIEVIRKLTEGDIYINVDSEYPASSVYNQVPVTRVHKFSGPHPAGNVGVHIHHIKPLNKGDILWYLYPQDLIMIGRLFQNGVCDFSKIVALTGSEVHKPRYYKTIGGTNISSITVDNVKEGEVRYISGNVLTGTKITSNGYLGFYDTQLTIIPEGNEAEFLGWASPGFKKYSFSRAFLSSVFPKKEYFLNTNLNGGERAFVMSGQYEKVLPMDVLPVYLLKAILAGDIEKMENLGIYEVTEEDMALCEFICTSKIEVQEILRKGINLMIKELG